MRKLLPLFLIVAGLSSCASSGTKELSHDEKAQLYLEAANAALMEGDTVSAFQHVMRAEQENSSLPDVYHMRALIYATKHDFNEAVAEARKALKLNPNFSAANNTLGKLLIDTGKYSEAVSPLLKAANDPLYREAYKAWTNLGILYYRQMDYKKSVTQLDHAIESSPELACIAYYYRGHIEMKNSELRTAIRDYDRATRRYCSNFQDAQLALGIAYERSKQYDRARKKFVEIRDQYPDTPIADQAVNHLRYLP